MAKVYFLACLVAGFELWSYIKLIMMFICWVVPPKKLSLKIREKLLLILDTLGKWSLIDFFTMV